MEDFDKAKNTFETLGFSVIDEVYTVSEIQAITDFIEALDTSNPLIRKSAAMFAIRQFIKEFPAINSLIFTPKLKKLIETFGGSDYFLVKSIYFDKPEQSNWFVSYHQDLTISVDKKKVLDHYGPWTVKQNQFAVQPPLSILENIFTIRIHLDATDEKNGALKVIDQSHTKAIYRPETIDWDTEKETICRVKAGGIMVMKPLLLHGSDRTVNQQKRRVIHLEFSNQSLPEDLHWAEYLSLRN